MDKLLLKLFLFFVIKLRPVGVDLSQLRIITEVKLMMDSRRTPPQWKKRQQKQMKNPMVFSMLMYALMSIFIGVQAFFIPSMVLVLIIFYSTIFTLLVMTLITDFSSVLLDTADNSVLIPKPISGRTIFLSRVLHISIYLSQFFISICLIPIVLFFISYGFMAGLTSLVGAILMALFSIFIAYLLYGLLLNFVSEQRLKDIIGYFQIAATVIFMLSFQILPSLLNFEPGYSFEPGKWVYLLPSTWFAMMVESFSYGQYDLLHLTMQGLSFLVPFLGLWLVIKFLAPSFSRKLAAMGEAVDSTSTNQSKTSSDGFRISSFWNNLLSNNGTEKAAFDLVWKITSRDKGFKIAFYPGLAYVFIFFFITVFKSGRNFSYTWETLQYGKSFLWLAYIPVMISTTAIYILPMYENFAASWIYNSSPVKTPGNIVNAAAKVILTKFFFPIYLLMFAFAYYVWGYKIIDDFILGLFNNITIFYIVFLLNDISLPFSQKPNIKQQSGKLIKTILQFLLVGAMVGLHYLAIKISYVVLALIPLAALAVFLLHKKLLNLPWAKIKI